RWELKANLRADGIGLVVHEAPGFGFDLGGVTEIQSAEGQVDRVARHISERAGAEILEAAPVERIVDSILIWPALGGAEPDVPAQGVRDEVGAFRAVHSLWPHGAVCPYVHFVHLADEAVLDAFDSATQAIGCAALIAHLCNHSLCVRQLAQVA